MKTLCCMFAILICTTVVAEEKSMERPIVQLGDPVLRQTARELTYEEIFLPETQELIQTMVQVMRDAPGVGLAAPQIGVSLQIAVIEDMNQSHLTPEEIEERERYPVPLYVIINPKLTVLEEEKAEFYEGCLSVNHYVAVVPRAKAVRVEALNEKGEPIVIEASGWHARILQHEIDHLYGFVYLDRAEIRTMATVENYMRNLRGKSIAEVQTEMCTVR